MPLGSKTRLNRVDGSQDPMQQQQPEQQGGVGKRAGQVVGGMFSFYGNLMRGAVAKVKAKQQAEEPPPFG